MYDPRPVAMLAALQCIALVALALWWITLDAPTQLRMLRAVWWQEHAASPPPATVVAQLAWLWDHRLARSAGLLGLFGVAGLIGLVEGAVWRRGDVYGGFRFAFWTVGVLGLALLPGACLGVLLLPWPLPLRAVGMGGAVAVGVTAFLLAAGRPQVR